MDSAGPVAVITGASRGLGAGMATFFLDQGIKIGICARTLPPFGDSQYCLARALDVTNAQSVRNFGAEVTQRFGKIDLWINNAGLLLPIGPIRDNNAGDFAQHIAVNVVGVFNGCQTFIRCLHAQGGEGVLINISSGAARNAYAGWSAYCAGKAAIDRMSECIALEESSHGLRVHAVAPGVIDSDMQRIIRQCPPEDFPKVQKFRDLKSTENFSTPDFVAERILDLAFNPIHRTDEILLSLPRPQR
ncbi:MAG: SDR family NAD(P)-dependent oxidoreductase [Thiohalocapsa sp.]